MNNSSTSLKDIHYENTNANNSFFDDDEITSKNLIIGREEYDKDAIKNYLTRQKWPIGFQEAYIDNLQSCSMRYFIIDDSGSMATKDSLRLNLSESGIATEEKASRWEELVDTVLFHARLAYAAKCPCEFRLLNNHAPILIGDSRDGDKSNLIKLEKALESPPKYMTPLCKNLKEIIEKITEMEPYLRSAGKKVKLIIATDGEASDGKLAEVMKPLRYLSVWIVVRLCTSSSKMSQYWADIDSELELNLDVIQNHILEAEEICTLNPWLNYTEPFHRLRETGILLKEADLLDECRLSLEQMLNICLLIFGSSYKGVIPHPEADVRGFLTTVEAAGNVEAKLLNPMTHKIEAHINTVILQKLLSHLTCCIIS